MKKTLFILLGLVLMLSLMLAACKAAAPTTSTTSAPTTAAPATTTKPATTTSATAAPTTTAAPTGEKYGGVYKLALTVALSRPIGWPCEFAGDSATSAMPALEGLVRVKKDGTVDPLLATSWKIADDGNSITLSLRKGIKFHDGSDFNAAVCKWNLDQQITAKKTADWKSIDVVDDYTVRINLNGYKNTILTSLASLSAMVSKASYDKNGLEYTRWHPVGTGAFIFADYAPGGKLSYKRNPSYWQPGKPYLDGVEFNVISDETVRKLAFQKGDINMIVPTAGLTSQELQKAGYQMKSESFGTYVLVPDSVNAASPWSNVNVRFAASYALDRESLVKALGYGFMKVAYQVWPGFAQSALPNLIRTNFDQAKARDLLKQAGYPAGFKTTLHSFTRVVSNDTINAVAAQLRAVGIDVTTDFPDPGRYDDLRYKGWNDGLLGHVFASGVNKNGDLVNTFTTIMFPSVAKPAGFTDGLNASLASKEPDPKLIQAVIQLLNDNMTVVPYMEETKVAFYQKGVHDDASDSFSLISFWAEEAWLEKSAR